MLKNYFTIALRQLTRNKLMAVLNIFGLALGVVAVLLIYIYVKDELSFDRHHHFADNTYRIQCFYTYSDVEDKFGIVPFPVVPALLNDYPDIEAATRLFLLSNQNFTYEGQIYTLEHCYFADTNFFDIFKFNFLHGDIKTALSSPDNIVLTDKEAIKIFGTIDALGKILVRYNKPLKVVAVIDSRTYNTHIELGPIMPVTNMMPQAKKLFDDNWGQNACFSYVVLKNDNAQTFQVKLDEAVNKHMLPRWKQDGFQGSIRMYAEPLKDIRFNNYLIYDTPKKGNKSYVIIFSIVGFLILIIACVNYINLSVAAATKRAKEVGLRKVVGANSNQLIIQFIGESLLISALAMLTALVLLWFMLAPFNEITGKEVVFSQLINLKFITFILLLLVVTGIIAGSYPAFYLSHIFPVEILKQQGGMRSGKNILRKSLLGLQFFIALFMIAGTLIVYRQLNFMQHKNLGFSRHNKIVIDIPQQLNSDSTLVKKMRALKEDIKQISGVNYASFGINIPGQSMSRWVLTVKRKTGNEAKPLATMIADYDFMKMMNIPLVDGRYHDINIPTDENDAVLVNEAAVKFLGWDKPLQEAFYVPGDSTRPEQKINVIGIVKDFHFASLHQPIEPLVIFMTSETFLGGYLVIDANSDNATTIIASVESKWKNILPDKTFTYTWLDDSLKELYGAEEKMFRVFLFFAGLSFFLSCLGLYGLSFFATRQRTREIGIRKVMGAQLYHILLLLNKEFLVIIGISFCIMVPIVWYVANEWLQSFAYREKISVMIFIISLLVTLSVAIITVSLQAMKTVLQKPVAALRYQ